MDIKSPIIPWKQTRGLKEPESAGQRDAKTLKAAYYAMIKLVDDQVGRMVDALVETGQLENTMIIFMSDHGETLGDHGLIQKGCRFYEGLVRVPLIISWPEKVLSGVENDALVELRDIAPMLLSLAGVDLPDWVDAPSLWPLLTGEKAPEEHRDFVRCEYYNALDMQDNTFANMFRDERYKLIVYHGHNLGEFYDLLQDPHEFSNLWDDQEHQAKKLELIQRSFDASMLAMDKGPPRIGPM